MKSKRIIFTLLLGLSVSTGLAQTYDYRGGDIALGLRTTGNIFVDEEAMRGIGAGGQFKIGISPRVNTEWFYDYISSRGDGTSYRNDHHIGWSVQFAFLRDGFGSKRFTPYVLGGQCFDLTRVGHYDWLSSPWVFSGAAQAGLGLSAFVGERMELTLQSQYMVHLGKDVHVENDPLSATGYHIDRGFDFNGHVLTTLSMNLYLLRLWNR